MRSHPRRPGHPGQRVSTPEDGTPNPVLRPRDQLTRWRILPQKALGQNFTASPELLAAVVEALAAPAGARVLEAGPGLGALTAALLAAQLQVTAFEIDPRLETPLRRLQAGHPDHLELVFADLLRLDLAPWLPGDGSPYFITGNLPYCCGTALLQSFLRLQPAPARVVVVLQQEVAAKAVAVPDSADYGYLSLALQLLARVEIGQRFSPAAFYPQPAVDSQLLCLEPLALAPVERQRRQRALELASFLFQHRRKQALGLLTRRFPTAAPSWSERFARLGLAPTVRGEAIPIASLLTLVGPDLPTTPTAAPGTAAPGPAVPPAVPPGAPGTDPGEPRP